MQEEQPTNRTQAVTDRADDLDPTPTGVGVLVLFDGKLLIGTRANDSGSGLICGPGGHIEEGETPEQAAMRETQEEFGIEPADLIPLALLSDMGEEYGTSAVFLCTDYDGRLACKDGEMKKPMFLPLGQIVGQLEAKPEQFFPPFSLSIVALLQALLPEQNLDFTLKENRGIIRLREDFDESKHPRDKGGKFTSGSSSSGGSSSAEKSESSAKKSESKETGTSSSSTVQASGQTASSAKTEPATKAAEQSPTSTGSTQTSEKSSAVPAAASGTFGGKTSAEFASAVENVKAAVAERNPDKAWRVTAHTQEELDNDYPNAKLHVTDGGSTVAVTEKGDIVSVCRMPGDTARGADLLQMAVDNGGTKLDSYCGNHKFYAEHGFEPVSWCEWDDQYAPPGWDSTRDKREPIIFYKYTGNKNGSTDYTDFTSSTPASADYDAAKDARDNSL